MKFRKEKLITIASKVYNKQHISPEEINYFLGFERSPDSRGFIPNLKRFAFPASFIVGMLFVVFSDFFKQFAGNLPPWTNLPPYALAGLDYIWNFIGEPIGEANILFHLPNVVLYTFGIAGVKTLLDTLEKKNWLEKVMNAQALLQENIQKGNLYLEMEKGFSLLFVGKGDFIGMQFALDHKPEDTVTISQIKPAYTYFWNYYDISTLYDDLKNVIKRSGGINAGEYIFFPVKDDQIFLPNETAYDLSPHKLDIICADIRTIEKELKIKPKRILIIGDKFHKSFVQSEDQKSVIKKSQDVISLESICKKYNNVTLLDPSDIVIKKIIKIAKGRKIVFRATKEGIKEYKTRFFDRLKQHKYKPSKNKKGVLTIGYDIFEDQTEQQTLSRKIDDYFPVVLSKHVYDALLRNGYKKSEFLYVPDLVLKTLDTVATQQ